MITAGIKDTKNNLSRYLALVKAGEDVVITEHGKAVARIIKEGCEEAIYPHRHRTPDQSRVDFPSDPGSDQARTKPSGGPWKTGF